MPPAAAPPSPPPSGFLEGSFGLLLDADRGVFLVRERERLFVRLFFDPSPGDPASRSFNLSPRLLLDRDLLFFDCERFGVDLEVERTDRIERSDLGVDFVLVGVLVGVLLPPYLPGRAGTLRTSSSSPLRKSSSKVPFPDLLRSFFLFFFLPCMSRTRNPR